MRLIQFLTLLALLALPLPAQTMERSDCDTVKLFRRDGSFQICGADRETVAAYRSRIEGAQRLEGLAFTEALRAIACDATQFEGNLRQIVDRELGLVAGRKAAGNEELYVAIAESGSPALLIETQYPERSDVSARGWERIARVASDRLVDTMMREILLDQLNRAGVQIALVERIARDPSDPVQFFASEVFVATLHAPELTAILADPTSPLFAAAYSEAAAESDVRPEVLRALCRIALDHNASTDARDGATLDIAYHAGEGNGECLACAARLLKKRNLFEYYGTNSAEVILRAMPRELAAPLARRFDTTVIADPAQREAVDALRLRILADSPRSPDDHCFRGLCMW